MKKRIALLLALMMVMSLSACGEKEPSITDKIPTPETTAPAPEETQAPVENQAPDLDMTTVETSMFTVSFPEEDGWEYDPEEDLTDKDSYCDLYLYILDEDDYVDVSLYFYVSLESPYYYREALYDRGFDQYALVNDNAYDFVTVGGQPLLQWDNSYGDLRYYFGRNEPAGAYLSVKVSNAPEDERVARVLDTLEFHVEDVGNVDGPWYWEGEPFSGGSYSTMVGTYTLSSQFLPMAEPEITHETFDHDIEIVGDKAYILSDGALKEFSFDGAGLTYVQDVPLDGEYDCIDVSSDGTLLLSAFGEPYIGLKDGQMVFSYDGPDYFAAAPDGTWGISYFTDPEKVQKFTFANGAMQTEPFPVTGLDMVTGIWVDDSYVYITGSQTETSAQILQVYDHAGALQKNLLGEDGRLGSITFATKTANGFLALDGNMRTIVLWSADGTYIGEADDGDIFGTDYPWFCAADVQPDGSIIVILTEDRDDESAMELVAYRLTGF